MEPKIVNKSLLLKNDDIKKHTIPIDENDPSLVMEVWVRDISFLDIQAAAQKMITINDGDIGLSLKGYWEFAFSNWITKTNPSLSTNELLSLKGYIGDKVSKVLPQPNEISEALQGGFTKPTE